MARFYEVTHRYTRKDAVSLATALSKHLKKEGYPSETKVTESSSVAGDYLISSTATPKQMTEFHNIINAEPIRLVGKYDPESEKIFGKHRKSYNKDMKKEMAARIRHQTVKRR